MKHKWSVCITAGLTALLLIGAAGLYLERPRTALEMTVKDEPSSAAESAAVQVTARTTSPTVKTQAETVTEVTKPVETAPPEHDLNRASEADLMRVPGIGEALAAEIVAARTACGGFTSRTQLCEISGIGETLMQRIMAEFEIPDEIIPPEPEEQQSVVPEPEDSVYYINVYDANTVTREELLTLPEMTEAKADAILTLRNNLEEFHGIYEISLAEGISGEYFERVLIHYLYIEGDPYSAAQKPES